MSQTPSGRPPKLRSSPVGTAVLTLIAAFMLYVAIPNITPAARAALGDGVPGVFTSRRIDCVSHAGHQSCTPTGEFRSVDGRVRRSDVTLCDQRRDSDSLAPGTTAAAVDIGRPAQVYAPGGCSREIVITLSLLALGLGILVTVGVRRLRRLTAARRRAARPAS